MNGQKEKPASFDAYAHDYAALMKDPIRDKFASGSRFYAERKIEIIRKFFDRERMPTRQFDWLDIGCGQGELLRLGRSYFKSSAGCDPSMRMLEFCQDLKVRHQSSMDSLPFEDAAFDFITAVCVYHHVAEDRRAALTAQALRVLRPGGVICLIEHNPLNPVTKLIVSRSPIDADAHLLTASQARRLLLNAGCRIVQSEFFLIFPERLHRFTRRIENSLGGLPIGGQYAIFGRRS